MQEQEEEIQFVDAENYVSAPDAPLTYEMIVLGQIRTCATEGNKEMTGGYYREKQTSRGLIQEYVPDQRQVYINTIKTLHDLLLPFFDDKSNDDIISFESTLTKIDKFIEDTMKLKMNSMPNAMKQEAEYGANFGYMNTDSIEFKYAIDKKLDAYRWLFQRLVLLFNRKKFLMQQAIED